MSLISACTTYRTLLRAQWLDREKLKAIQEQKLRKLVKHAYSTIPYYKRRFDEAGIDPAAIRSLDDLARIPITSRSDLQCLEEGAIRSSLFSSEALTSEHTSGSTGRPSTIYYDSDFIEVRNGLFWRALHTAGYRAGQRVMLVTTRRGNRSRRFLRWRYVSIEESPETILAKLNRFRPHILYGCLSPLRLLTTHLRDSGRSVHRPRVVISTAETLDCATRWRMEMTFGAEVFDIYGLSETGIIGWECRQHNGYHIAEDTAIVEFTPSDTDGPESKLVVTNLDLLAMPYIRFETGDLVVAGPTSRCACGRTLRRILRVEGRTLDSVKLQNGHAISPYRLIHALGAIPHLERYQVVQETLDSFTVRFESRCGNGRELTEEICLAVRRVVGAQVHVRLHREATLEPRPGQKFRLVESRIPLC